MHLEILAVGGSPAVVEACKLAQQNQIFLFNVVVVIFVIVVVMIFLLLLLLLVLFWLVLLLYFLKD